MLLFNDQPCLVYGRTGCFPPLRLLQPFFYWGAGPDFTAFFMRPVETLAGFHKRWEAPLKAGRPQPPAF